MKVKNILISILSLTILSTSNIKIVNAGDNGFGGLPKVQYESEYDVSYYKNIKGLKGDNLLEGLALISQDNHKTFTSYKSLNELLAYSDKNPNDSSKIIDFYTGWSLNNTWDSGKTWNKEHVWCQSLSGDLFGKSYAGADIHHIRPLTSGINSARNNGKFTDRDSCGPDITLEKYTYNNKDTGCYNKGQSYWEPRDAVKGDVARILMYMYMHYSNEVSANESYVAANNDDAEGLRITNIVYTPAGSPSSAWNMLIKWNALDPVDNFESNRNNYCASVTGVRNPFIDHEEFANMIWNSSYNGEGALNDTEIPDTPITPENPETPDTPITPEVPDTSTSATYVFSSYQAGTQYADNEKHELDNNTSVITTDCHFTEQLRIYSSSTYNGYAIIESKKPIIKMDLNIGYKIDKLNIYSSDDKLTWTFNTSVTTTSTSYIDYSATLAPSSKYLKLDVNGSNQLRIKSITLYFEQENNVVNEIKQIDTKAQLDFSYSYEEGTSKELQAKSIVKEDVTCNDSSINHASNINLNPNDFNVSFIKGDPTSSVIKSDGTIRLYANRKSGVGNTLIIELKDKSININTMSFTSTNSNVLEVKNSKGDIINPINGEYKINDYKFTIQNIHYDVNAENNINAFISLINIKYGSSTNYFNFNSINLRYSAIIPDDLFEYIDSYGINIKVKGKSIDYEIEKTTIKENGQEFALVIKDIKDLSAEITATAYVYVDNERIELKSKTYSVSTIIEDYILYATDLKLSPTQIEVLNAFKESLKED